MSTTGKQGQGSDRDRDEWQQDLNPNPMAGQNVKSSADREEIYDRTAHDIKALHDQLEDFTTDELKQIPVLQPGTRLKQGAIYINLNDPARQEFKATASQEADENNLIVPKSEVGYQLWNRLIGVENPERLT